MAADFVSVPLGRRPEEQKMRWASAVSEHSSTESAVAECAGEAGRVTGGEDCRSHG